MRFNLNNIYFYYKTNAWFYILSLLFLIITQVENQSEFSFWSL